MDKYKNQKPTVDSVAVDGFAITPSDSTTLSQPTRAVYVGGTGNLKVMMLSYNNANTVVTFVGVPSGTVLPIRVQRVYSGNTSATALIGLY